MLALALLRWRAVDGRPLQCAHKAGDRWGKVVCRAGDGLQSFGGWTRELPTWARRRHTSEMLALEPRQVPLDHPDARYLIGRVQRIYVERYGGSDDDPLDPTEFAEPNGGFYVGYLDRRPVASGAWRRSGHPALDSSNTAEIKRMYVVEEAQRRGIARRMLTHLESEVARAGIAVITLGTGSRQPEALALYRQAGYVPILGFGRYAASPSAHFLGKRLVAD